MPSPSNPAVARHLEEGLAEDVLGVGRAAAAQVAQHGGRELAPDLRPGRLVPSTCRLDQRLEPIRAHAATVAEPQADRASNIQAVWPRPDNSAPRTPRRRGRRWWPPALELFTAAATAAVGTEEIVERAKVTRGALYHHFEDKRDLFRAVHERVEERPGRANRRADGGRLGPLGGDGHRHPRLPRRLRRAGGQADRPGRRPAVLGWREWREIDERYGLGPR